MRESDHGHDAAQEEVDLGILRESHKSAPIHQAEVGVIEHDVRTERAHGTIEALRRKALEEGIRSAVLAHAVDDVRPRSVLLEHEVNRMDVVLQIGIHADGHVCVRQHGHQPREEGILMPLVVREIDP